MLWVKRAVLTVGMVLVASFPFWIGGAITEYAGGTVLESRSEGYDHVRNFMSDLGRTKGYDLTNNEGAATYFGWALYTFAIGIILIQGVWLTAFKTQRARQWAGATFLLTLVGAIHFWGIVEYTLDMNYPQHTKFVVRAFGLIALSHWAAAFAIRFEPKYPSFISSAWFVVAFIATAHWIIMVLGPRSWSSDAALLLQVTLQKATILAYWVALLVHGWIAWRCVKLLNY